MISHSVLSICVWALLIGLAQSRPGSVEAAEDEGAQYPKPVNLRDRPADFAAAVGPRERRCVDADAHRMARSGEFVAGPFDEYVVLAGTGKRKVWWAPQQNSVGMPPLRLRATKVGAPGLNVDWTLSSVARNENGLFFNTMILFPENGKWLVVVSSGTNWGCFLLSETQALR